MVQSPCCLLSLELHDEGQTLVSIMARALVVGLLITSNLKGSGFGIGFGSKGFSNPFVLSS